VRHGIFNLEGHPFWRAAFLFSAASPDFTVPKSGFGVHGTCTQSIVQMQRTQRTTWCARVFRWRMESKHDGTIRESASPPVSTWTEIADSRANEQIAVEATAVSRLRDRRGYMRSRRIFALAVALPTANG
jgi:hypothetical protein